MYTKPKTKKACRTTPIAIENKLKPLPNIGIASKVTCVGTCKNRNSTTVSKPCSRSSDRAGRSGSVTERDPRPVRMGKVLHSLNKKPRDSIKYTTYGRSSDTSFEDPARRPLLPDPYADLRTNLDGAVPLDPNAPWWLFLAEMKLQARRQEVILDNKPEPQHSRHDEKIDMSLDVKEDSSKARKHDTKIEAKSDEEIAMSRNNSKSEDSKYVTENDESSTSKSSDHKAKESNSEEDKGKEDTAGQDDNDNDDEEDEEEDEMGLPQAVRALQSKPVSLNAREVVKERHRAMMEEIARTVRAHSLMGHLKSQGFFNYDYSPHARTNMTNHNLRKGKKKGIERLLLLLACRPAKCTGELFGV